MTKADLYSELEALYVEEEYQRAEELNAENIAEDLADYYYEDIIEQTIKHNLDDKWFLGKVLYFIKKRYREEYTNE